MLRLCPPRQQGSCFSSLPRPAQDPRRVTDKQGISSALLPVPQCLIQLDIRQVTFALSNAIDLVGVDSIQHGKRVAYMADACGSEANLRNSERIDLFHAGLQHDLGKLRVPDEILQKTGPPGQRRASGRAPSS